MSASQHGAPGSVGYINTLQPPLLSTIFSFTTFKTIVCVYTLVCKRWCDAAKSPLSLSGQCVTLTSAAPIVHGWAPCFSAVKQLDMRLGALTDQALTAFSPHHSSVEQLSIVTPVRLSSVLADFIHTFNRLTHLRVIIPFTCEHASTNGDCAMAEEAVMSLFTKHFPYLTSLNIVYGFKVGPSPSYVVENVLPFCTSLTHLRHNNTSATEFCDLWLPAIAKHCPLMQDLRLHSLYQHKPATDASLRALASGCPRLSTISLEGWQAFSLSQLKTLLLLCPSVNHLILYHMPQHIDSMELCLLLCAHPHVTRLAFSSGNIIGSPYVTRITMTCEEDGALMYIGFAIRQSPNVRCLKIKQSVECSLINRDITSVSLLDIRRRFPCLKRLVWQRLWLRDASKTEARCCSEGQEDPKTYRVVF